MLRSMEEHEGVAPLRGGWGVEDTVFLFVPIVNVAKRAIVATLQPSMVLVILAVLPLLKYLERAYSGN